MPVVFHQLLQTAGGLVIVSILLGFVFDRVPPGRRRELLVGLTCGAFCTLAMAMPLRLDGGWVIDGRGPFLVIAGLFGGPLGALAAAPLPLISRISTGGPAVLIGISSIVLALSVGTAIHLFRHHAARALTRRWVLVAAAFSPAILLSLLVPHLAPTPGMLASIVWPLLLWTPAGTLILGLTTLNELTRSNARRQEKEADRFCDATGHVSSELLDRQLHHHFHMHERYGVKYAYMLVSIDDASTLRRELGRRAWREGRERVARVVRSAVRDCDLCAPLDFDRFAVLLPHTSREGTRPVAERIMKRMAEEFCGPVRWSVSIGLSDVLDGGAPADVAIAAEGALFLANSETPRGAIGPAVPADPTGTRSFPGLVPTSAGPQVPPRLVVVEGSTPTATHAANPAPPRVAQARISR